MSDSPQFISKNPRIGARTATEKGFKVDANGVPLDIVAKQLENQKKNGNDDITNNPMFAEMFGHPGVEVKDPIKQGGNEDHWFSGTPRPIPKKEVEQQRPTKKVEDIPLENQIVPTNDPNDITNNPKLKEMLKSMEEHNESDSSDSHMETNK